MGSFPPVREQSLQHVLTTLKNSSIHFEPREGESDYLLKLWNASNWKELYDAEQEFATKLYAVIQKKNNLTEIKVELHK